MKKYQELSFVDDFMFCKVMTTNPGLCTSILSLILKKKVKNVIIHGSQQEVQITAAAKGIRMDVYMDDDEGTVYDLEMQTTYKKHLPKRLRYYQAMLDLNHLESGDDYIELPHTIIIFICTFDYFHRYIPIYTFENRCVEAAGLAMGDEAEKIFVNPDSSRDGLDQDLIAFLDYLQGKKTDNGLICEIEEAVKKARAHKEWEVEYMTWQAFEMDARREGRMEGRMEGRREGRMEGRREDIERMLRNGKSIEQIEEFCGYERSEIEDVHSKMLQSV